ncbi:MAG: DUF86 domain-containing protein [Pyrinomonadaceae bacterium]
MERDVNTHLFDVIENCKRIHEFVGTANFDTYSSDELIKSAVERQFINIGESLSRLKQIDLLVFGKIANAQRIIGFRNVLVHGYESISDRLVWEIIKENLSELRATCEDLLK